MRGKLREKRKEQSIVVGDAKERATLKYKREEEGSNHRMWNCGPMMLLALLQLVLVLVLVLVRFGLACESDHPMACAPPPLADQTTIALATLTTSRHHIIQL